MWRPTSLQRYLRANSGVAAIEFCFIFPLMLFLYFGLFDLTGLITKSRKITMIAATVADIVGQNQTQVRETDIQKYFKVASLVMKPEADTTVRILVHVYRKDGANIEKEWTVDNGKGPDCSDEPDVSKMAPLMSAGNDLIVTQVCSYFQPYIGQFLGVNIIGSVRPSIEQHVTIRPRASLMLSLI